MLSQVLLPREAGAWAAFAVVEGTEERLLGTAVHLVNFTFVAKKAAAVSEALKFLATLDVTLIRSVMFVHVFAVVKLVRDCC
jgi:hypothetical protein